MEEPPVCLSREALFSVSVSDGDLLDEPSVGVHEQSGVLAQHLCLRRTGERVLEVSLLDKRSLYRAAYTSRRRCARATQLCIYEAHCLIKKQRRTINQSWPVLMSSNRLSARISWQPSRNVQRLVPVEPAQGLSPQEHAAQLQ